MRGHYDGLTRGTARLSPDGIEGEALQSLLRKVHLLMTVALGVTALFAWICAGRGLFSLVEVDGEVSMAMSEYWIGAIVAEIVVVLILIFGIEKLNTLAAFVLFLAYSALNGVTITPVVMAYTGGSVVLAFGVTAGTFLGMSIYGYVTKRDLDTIGAFFAMALLGLIIAMVLGFFLQSEFYDMLISGAAVIVFCGLTAWDTQKIKKGKIPGARSGNQVVFGALMLYLDFINLFLHLLRLVGNKK